MKTKHILVAVLMLIIGISIGKFAFKNKAKVNHQYENETEHWTCSMHPQFDMPEFGACPICGMDLIKKTKSDDSLSNNSFKMSANAMALANIETIIIGKNEDVFLDNNTLKLSGKIMVNEKSTAIQTAHFGGRIENLKFKSVGEYVKKGSLIASIYSPELVTAQNEFIEALKIKIEQPELYNAVRNKLKNWKIPENQIQQIEQTKRVITNFNMYANVSGYIEEILIQEGNHLKEGTPLFKVNNLASVWAIFDVYENDIKHLKIGQDISIKLHAYPEKEIKAKINFINPNLDVNTRTVSVRTTLRNIKKLLKPGMLLSSEVSLNRTSKNPTSAIKVSKTAILWTGKRSVVYLKIDKNKPIFELQEVELGNSLGNYYEILSGLEKGDEVVSNGTFTVDAAAQLQGKSSMMKRATQKMKKQPIKRIEVNATFKKQLNTLFSDYIAIKNAFILTDATKVSKKATQNLQRLKKTKIATIKNEKARQIWLKESKKMKNILEKIEQELDVEKQRNLFIDLSNIMIYVTNSFGVNKTIYVQHCPMADNNKGADWLSFEKEIKNPYFGNKMLKCGTVKQTIE